MKSLPKPKLNNNGITFLGGSMPYVIGDYMFWEHESKPELWRCKINSEKWEKRELNGSDEWKPLKN